MHEGILTCTSCCLFLSLQLCMIVDHPGVIDPMDKRNIRVNGDGFGIAW
jgi:hypothetical protein